jgi:hypothetical protein
MRRIWKKRGGRVALSLAGRRGCASIEASQPARENWYGPVAYITHRHSFPGPTAQKRG